MQIKKNKLKSGVLWITGLSGSGKTTIAKMLNNHLKKKYSKVIWLDGDQLRKKLKLFHNKNTFSFNFRIKLGKKYSKIARSYEKKGFFVIISVMALSKEVFKFNRRYIKNYHEIYLNIPLSELKTRDPKKIYRNFQLGKIKNVAGLDVKFDKPRKPSLVINWKKGMSKIDILKKLKNYFYKYN
jgi:adenylylsulfate kinase-like enzyme